MNIDRTRPVGGTGRMRFAVTAMASCLGLHAAGCGIPTGDGLVDVSGIVTYQGKPLSSGMISFVPVDKESRGASGSIDSEGRYVLMMGRSQKGVPPGEYRVRIESWLSYPSMTEPGKLAIPTKFLGIETSDLNATVDGGRSEQTIDFALEE